MRRTQALLLAVGLAAAPLGATAAPCSDHPLSNLPFFKLAADHPARLGVQVTSLTPELRTHLGAQADRGMIIGRVEARSPAALAGLGVGDVLVEVHGQPIRSTLDIAAALAGLTGDETFELRVMRDRQPVVLRTTLGTPRRESAALPMQWLRDLMKPLRPGAEPTTTARS
jgi:predicted metalloprotease with PDZ domain